MKKYDVAIIGMGYVGLTLATAFAEVGLKVIGIEKINSTVKTINNGKPHFSELGLEQILQRVVTNGNLIVYNEFPNKDCADVYIITVGTPLDDSGLARLDMIQSAAGQVAENMIDGALVILRSTVKIGTSRKLCEEIFNNSGKKYLLAMCPERTLEGRALQELRVLPQIIGSEDAIARKKASTLFNYLTNNIVEVSTLEAAEIIKLVDNTYRDVQFAFANEVARACESYSVNAHEVIHSGKLGYERTNVALPGLVGGPCLEKDPHIFIQSLREKGINLEITESARLINERQPAETLEFIFNQIYKRSVNGILNFAVLGLAFKGVPETDDLRGSMTLKIINLIINKNPNIKINAYDPVIDRKKIELNLPGVIIKNCIEDATLGADVIIIANNHPIFKINPPSLLLSNANKKCFIFDYWNHFGSVPNIHLNKNYFGVGNIYD